MPRTVSQDLINALAGDSFQIAHLIFLDIGGGIYITDNAYDVFHINNYTASGHLMEVGSPTETRDLRVNTLNIGLSGVDQAYISIFLQSDWINRRARVQKAVIEGSSIVGSPLTVFDGQITNFQISESDSGSDVTVAIASHWADFNRKAGRLTNNITQQYFFPNDLGFEYSANTVQDIKWGRS